MGFPIKDGTGNAYEAEVDALHRLATITTTKSAFAKASDLGKAFSWTAVSADIDATDTALLVCNDSTTEKLHITKVYCYADVATLFQIHLPAYPTLAGTAVTGVCLNKSINATALATAKADETGNTQGSIIKTLRNNEVGTDQFGVMWDFEGAVILGYHDSVAIDIVAESAAFSCSIDGYYE